MTKRSEQSGRPAVGGTLADDGGSPALAKTQNLTPNTGGTLPEVVGELPVIERSHYAIKGELGRGGLGRILRAQDRFLDRTVAIKEGLHGNEVAQARFIREALVTARLQHPSIVPVYEAGRWPTGEPFYAMKLVSGRPLSAVIEETTTLDQRLALLPNLIAVADAIAYAHSQRIIHRDLKPDNVLVGEFGETVVIDWGLAKDLSAGDDDEKEAPIQSPYQIVKQGLTMAGAIMGTPEYMSPEQAQGEHVDERSDVYSLGCILYHVLVGEPPFRGESLLEIIAKIAAATPKPLESQAGMPNDLASVVRKAMAKEPADRYPTAKQLADDLRRFQTGQLVSSKQYSAWQLFRRWARKHRTVLSVASAAAVILAIVGVLAITNIVHERENAERAQANAEARTNELILVQARSALDHDPAEALAWLKTYPTSAPGWSEAHEIAVQAQSLGPARHVLEHTNALWLAFAPDGKQLASYGRDREIVVWDVARGTRAWTIPVSDNVLHLAFGATAIAFEDSAGVLYLARPGAAAVRLASHPGMLAMTLSPDSGRVATFGDNGIHVIDLASATEMTFADQTGAVTAVAFSADASQLASVGNDKTVRLHDLASKKTRIIATQTGALIAIAFAADGKRVVTGARDGNVTVWPLDGSAPLVLRGHQTDVERVEVSRDGERIVSIDANQLIVWNAKTGERVRTLAHSKEVQLAADVTIATLPQVDDTIRVVDLRTGDEHLLRGAHSIATTTISPDGRVVGAIGTDFAIHIWEEPQVRSHTLRGHTDELRNARFTPDGKLLVTASTDATLRAWPTNGGDSRILAGHAGLIFDIGVSLDGTLVASASVDKTARVWSLATGESRVLAGHTDMVWGPMFSPDGKSLYTSSRDATVRRWELATGASQILEQREGINFDLSSDGSSLVTASDDGALRLWNLADATSRVIGTHPGAVGEVRFVPNSHYIVSRADISATGDRTVRLWDATTGTGKILVTGRSLVRTIASAPDGKSIAIGGQDRVIQIVDLETGALRELHGHTDTIKSLRFTSDSRFVVSGSYDGTLRLWEVSSGASQIMHRHGSRIWDVEISPDGSIVASTSADKTAWLGSIDVSRCLPTAPAALLPRIHDMTTARVTSANRARTQ